MRKTKAKIKNLKIRSKTRRKLSIRSRISGTGEVPRLSVSKSNSNFYVQAIDDVNHKTLFSVKTFGKNAEVKKLGKDSIEGLSKAFAEKANELKIKSFKFDRGGNKFTGLIKMFAESVKSEGIKL